MKLYFIKEDGELKTPEERITEFRKITKEKVNAMLALMATRDIYGKSFLDSIIDVQTELKRIEK